jgi:hypothetical protein
LNAQIGTGQAVLDAYNESSQTATARVDELTVAQSRGENVIARYNELARDGGAAWDTNTDSIEDNIAALQEQQDAIRAQTDPLFNLFDATRQHADAQQAVNDAVSEFGEGSPEHIDALADLATEAFNLRDAQANARVATDLTKDAFFNMATQAGLTRDQAKQLSDVLFGLSGLKLDPIQLAVEIRELRRSAGSMAGGPQEYHSGGVVQGDFVGQEVLIKALAGEIVTPIGQAPPTVPASLAGARGGVNIENLYAMGTPASIAHDVGQVVALEMRMA